MNSGARKEAIQIAQKWVTKQPVYIDTETTGTGPDAGIVEIAVIDHDGSVLVDSLVKPVGTIPANATAIHSITNEMVREAPRWEKVWQDVEKAVSNRAVGIYNADFDLRMMRQSHQINWMQWYPPEGTEFFCIMKLYAQFYGAWNSRRGSFRWQSLEAAGRQCDLPLPNSHRAKDDTLLTLAVLEYMAHQTI
jgi:DNA polymerase III epsilon subunit-like protein